MSEPGAKICPRCEGEYQSWVTECPDCEIELVSPAELAERQRADLRQSSTADVADAEADQQRARVPRLEPNEGRLFRAGDQDHCVAIAKTLTAHGVSWRIAPVYGVFILEEDREDAEDALEQEALHGVPDVQPAPAAPDGHCPACSFKLKPGETECPECGLVFG